MSTPSAVPEPAAEPPVAAEGTQLSLKVRTLDQRTYPITVCAAASVPQLKELVAVETGVTLARQRLIYRGRVLKNDQALAAYALEDGHVLHLVVRAAQPPADAAAAAVGQAPATAASAPDPNAGRDAPSAGGGAPASNQYTATEMNTLNEIDALNARLDEFERSSLRSRLRSRQRRGVRSPPPPPRDNDEPDPTMGRPGGGSLPNRVLMGATISVPEGADVTMPFLSSMIANLVTQVSEGGVGVEAGQGTTTGMTAGGRQGTTTETTADGRRHVTFLGEALGDGSATEMEAATARALRHHHRNRDRSVSGSRLRHARRSSSSSAERQAAMRARTGLQLESARATLDDASLDFPAELTALPQGDTNAAMTELQQQVEMLLTLVQRFGPRLRLLPSALAQRDRMGVAHGATLAATLAGSTTASTGPAATSVQSNTASAGATGTSTESTAVSAETTAALSESTVAPAESATGSTPNASNTAAAAAAATDPTVSSRHVIRAIEVLQTIGESTDLLTRMARHAFVRQSVQLGEPLSRRISALNTGGTTSDRVQATLDAIQAGVRTGSTAGTTERDRVQATLHAMQGSTRTARSSTRSAANSRPRFRVARISAADLLGSRRSTGAGVTAPTGTATGSTLNFPVDLTDSTRGAAPPASGSVSPAPSTQSDAPNRRADADPNNVSGPVPPAGAHISISGMGLPLMSSVVFPFSLAAGLGGSHATTTWNLADFVSRLTSELPISTLYGVMAGDATHLHHILAHIGFALFSGVDVPRVTRPSIRTWAQDLVRELHRLLRLHALPADVLDQVSGSVERRSALGDELLRVVEPFIPDLVDFLVRATSASRAAAFGTSSATFLRTMAQEVVRQLRVYARGDSTESEDDSDERLKRLLRGMLVWLGMNEHMASFVVESMLCWTEGDNRRGRTRQREEATTEAGATDSPATKRRRE